MIRISEEEYARIKAAAKENKNKNVAKRLKVLELRYAGMSNAEISIRTGFNNRYITTLMGQYKKQGLDEFIRIKYTSHHRHLSESEEAEVLEECAKAAESGQILTASMMREKLEERIGKKASHNYVYQVLKRHEWRQVMPRAKHPQAASEEEQNSSKKSSHCTTKSPSKMRKRRFG